MGSLETIEKQREPVVIANVCKVNFEAVFYKGSLLGGIRNIVTSCIESDITVVQVAKCIFLKSCTSLKWCNSSNEYTNRNKCLSPGK